MRDAGSAGVSRPAVGFSGGAGFDIGLDEGVQARGGEVRDRGIIDLQLQQLGRIFGSSVYLTALALFISLSEPITASCGKAAPPQGPIVHEPVSPKSSDTPVQELIPAPQWKPGDPVQVRPDLKSSSQPKVSDPVTPKVKEDSLKEAPTVAPPPADAPVRVVPDLRETPPPSDREPKR